MTILTLSQIAQLRWRNIANVGMVAVGTTTLAQRRHGRCRHNYVGATSFSQRCPNVRKLRRGTCFPGVKYKISHKNGFELKYTIYIYNMITYL